MNLKTAGLLATFAVSGCGYTPMALYSKECANLGITQSNSRYVDCVAWREQVSLQRNAAFNQNLATTAAVINMLNPPVQQYQVQWR